MFCKRLNEKYSLVNEGLENGRERKSKWEIVAEGFY